MWTGRRLGRAQPTQLQLRALARLHPKLVGAVLQEDGQLTPAYAVNLNGLRFCSDLYEPISEKDELLVISSLAGG